MSSGGFQKKGSIIFTYASKWNGLAYARPNMCILNIGVVGSSTEPG